MNIYTKELHNPTTSNLIFTKNHSSVIPTSTDIGFELANELKNFDAGSKLPLVAIKKLHEIIEKNLIHDDKLGDVYSINNIGILVEPRLKIDFVSLCKKYSRDSTFIIEHKGDIDDKYLYFLTKEKGKKIALTDLNYTIL